MDYFGVCGPSLTGPDSLTLQEMLDMDIKCDSDFDSVFGCGEINLNFNELPALNLDEDSLGAPGDNNVWFTNSRDGSLLGGDTNSSIGQELNSLETRMVSPNSVMPVTLIEVPYDVKSSKTENSAKSVKVKVDPKLKMESFEIKDEGWDRFSQKIFKQEVDDFTEEDDDEESVDDEESIPNHVIPVQNHQQDKSLLTNGHSNHQQQHQQRVRVGFAGQTSTPVRPVSLGGRSGGGAFAATAAATRNKVTVNTGGGGGGTAKKRDYGTSANINGSSAGENGGGQYPKPAYSYSCLIAMALKNSPNGSLPVSEIYNFMCKHFPYFKTAPNGWKNSVRHNLSLNKCFEKIEKPATNGSQRKGCLWAMNPNKIDKMNEEVSKWSKKDKSAIKKSMIFPESLDALEQGLFLSGTKDDPVSSLTSDLDSDPDDQWEPSRSITNTATSAHKAAAINGSRAIAAAAAAVRNNALRQERVNWLANSEDEEEGDDDDDDDEDDDEDEDDEQLEDGDIRNTNSRISGDPLVERLNSDQVTTSLGDHDINVDYDSDISLDDLDVEFRSSEDIMKRIQSEKTLKNSGQIKMRVNVHTTSPSNGGSFQPLTSGGVTYALTSQTTSENSPKRLKTLGGSTITGNYVYKPLGSTSIRKRSPLRQTLLSSLEADD